MTLRGPQKIWPTDTGTYVHRQGEFSSVQLGLLASLLFKFVVRTAGKGTINQIFTRPMSSLCKVT